MSENDSLFSALPPEDGESKDAKPFAEPAKAAPAGPQKGAASNTGGVSGISRYELDALKQRVAALEKGGAPAAFDPKELEARIAALADDAARLKGALGAAGDELKKEIARLDGCLSEFRAARACSESASELESRMAEFSRTGLRQQQKINEFELRLVSAGKMVASLEARLQQFTAFTSALPQLEQMRECIRKMSELESHAQELYDKFASESAAGEHKLHALERKIMGEVTQVTAMVASLTECSGGRMGSVETKCADLERDMRRQYGELACRCSQLALELRELSRATATRRGKSGASE